MLWPSLFNLTTSTIKKANKKEEQFKLKKIKSRSFEITPNLALPVLY